MRRGFDWLRNALAAFGLLFAVVTFTPLVSWWAHVLASPWQGPEGDVLIVLAGSHQTDTIGESSYLRALYAVRCYRGQSYRRILIAGHQASEAMREFLIGEGVPAERIEVDTRSTSTRENVLELTPMIARERREYPQTRFVLLTSDYHVYRSARLFEKAGVKVSVFPAPDVLKRSGFLEKRWPAFIDLCVETSKVGYYLWKGWL